MVAEDASFLEAADEVRACALHHAAWKGNAPMVALLLSLGANVNSMSHDSHYGGSPLHAAAHGNHVEVAAILIDHGADINAVSCNGRSPLQETEIHNAAKVAKLLRERAAKGVGD